MDERSGRAVGLDHCRRRAPGSAGAGTCWQGDGIASTWSILTPAQAAAAALALARLSRGWRRRPPLVPGAVTARSVSVVIPARDEAGRIAPCLAGLAADPAVSEVVVVDDGSTDGTAAVARAHGARVVRLPRDDPPAGWVGKPWALQHGVEEATGEVVVCLDADTRPRPGLVAALAGALEEADLVSGGPRFICDGPGERWLHPSFLTSLVYRFGPADAPGGRLLANGQCTAVERGPFLAAGGYRDAAGHMTDDTALARGLAAQKWRVAFRDASALLDVDMHASAREVWREWGRSIALADVTPRRLLVTDVAVVWLVLALPVLRAATGRATRLDVALLAVRAAMLGALAPAYARRGLPYWLSPLADPATAVRVTWSALRPPRRWRGRVYAAGGRARR